MWWRATWGLGLFAGSMAAGWALARAGRMTQARAGRLVRWLIKGPAPVMLCLAFWGMDLRRADVWMLPIVGFLVSMSALAPAFLYSRHAAFSAPQTGSFLTCAMFSNLGYLGAYTAFALYGETAYALCVLYFMFFTPCFYTLGFSLARHYGRRRGERGVQPALGDDLRLYPFLGMVAGSALSWLGIARPAWLSPVNHALITTDTVLSLVAVGSQLLLVSPRRWLEPCLAMSGIKLLVTPLVAWAVVSLLHLQGLPRFVVLLEASMPVGVSPLLLPLLFGLDRRLTNALWLFTTLVSIPWLLLVLPLLQRW
ncbi:MAG: AEC family transporter [Candidatus Omnitrophica bacterium]|nr:AEC family transporter [Candidatus Omnitrophota bacterium]